MEKRQENTINIHTTYYHLTDNHKCQSAFVSKTSSRILLIGASKTTTQDCNRITITVFNRWQIRAKKGQTLLE